MVFAHMRGLQNLSVWESVKSHLRDSEMIDFLKKEQGLEVKMLTSSSIVTALDEWPGSLSHFECVLYAVKIFRYLSGTLDPTNIFGQIEMVGQLLKWSHTSKRGVRHIPLVEQQDGVKQSEALTTGGAEENAGDAPIGPLQDDEQQKKKEEEAKATKKKRAEKRKREIEQREIEQAKREARRKRVRAEYNKRRREQYKALKEEARVGSTVDVVDVSHTEAPPVEVVRSDDVRKVVLQQVLAQTQWLVSDVSKYASGKKFVLTWLWYVDV